MRRVRSTACRHRRQIHDRRSGDCLSAGTDGSWLGLTADTDREQDDPAFRLRPGRFAAQPGFLHGVSSFEQRMPGSRKTLAARRRPTASGPRDQAAAVRGSPHWPGPGSSNRRSSPPPPGPPYSSNRCWRPAPATVLSATQCGPDALLVHQRTHRLGRDDLVAGGQQRVLRLRLRPGHARAAWRDDAAPRQPRHGFADRNALTLRVRTGAGEDVVVRRKSGAHRGNLASTHQDGILMLGSRRHRP